MKVAEPVIKNIQDNADALKVFEKEVEESKDTKVK